MSVVVPKGWNPQNLKNRSWVTGADTSEFPVQNLPYGVFSTSNGSKKVGVAIGDFVIDVSKLLQNISSFSHSDILVSAFLSDSINSFMGLGKQVTGLFRQELSFVFSTENNDKSIREKAEECLLKLSEVSLHLPVRVADYVDFYSSEEHATNVGKMFRDPDNALLPNWKHIPIGYHGRSSTIVASGTSVRRPVGQRVAKAGEAPRFEPCKALDFELEVGFVVGKETEVGERVSTDQAKDYIFGICMVNDWSARGIQKWEYVPLGPFLGKSFATTISHWIVPLEAFENFWVEGPKQNPKVLPYLEFTGPQNINMNLVAQLKPKGSAEYTNICETNFSGMYWNMAQQLTHLSSNGSKLSIGDLCASGTVSGPTKGSFGSLLEISWGGKEPLQLSNGETRTYILDGDSLNVVGYCEKDGVKIGFGPCEGLVTQSEI